MKSSEILNALRICRSADLSVMIWGLTGVGKSDTVRSFSQEIDGPLYDLRLSTIDPVDLRGVPMYDSIEGVAKWMQINGMLPKDTDKNAILFLDEIVSAPPSIQAAAYQLVLDRRIGDYCLPEGTFVVAAGNISADKGVVYPMPGPLRNRFVHYNFDLSVEDWTEWALKNEIHEDIISFINYQNHKLHDFKGDGAENAFPTPRSWASASKIYNIQPDVSLISGAVGEGTAIELFAYSAMKKYLPDFEDIFEGKVTELSKEAKNNISIHYSLAFGAIHRLKTYTDNNIPAEEFCRKNTILFDFMIKNLSKEMFIFYITNLQKSVKEVFSFNKGRVEKRCLTISASDDIRPYILA